MHYETVIKGLTLEEKAAFLSGGDYWHTAGLKRLGIEPVCLTDGPHGIRKKGEDDGKKSGDLLLGVPAICYPTASATACSWDPDLLYEMGTLLGEECLQERVSVLLGPGMNIKRSPLCGRNFEYFSEDPFLAGKLAAGFIRGVQSKGVGTSLKHYAVNNQETRRMTISAVADERALREIYLTGFEIAVREAQPWTVMCMYNRLNGVYGAENQWLLTDMLRDEFGFEGVVVTDWGANNDRVEGLKAGQDLEMPSSGGIGTRKIIDAVRDGSLDEAVVDEAVDRVLTMIYKSMDALANRKYDVFEHHAAARRIASQCMVLMKNEGGLLPLSKDANVAVIGQFAKQPRYQGAGSSLINPIKLDKPLDAIMTKANVVAYADGYKLTKKDKRTDGALIGEAVEAAKQADVCVVVAGLTDEYESEGFDRRTMTMPKDHVLLIESVVKANPNTVVVLCGGSAVEMPWIGRVPAVLNAFLTGEAGGSAMADLLFGDANPCGKLAETYPLKLADNPSYRNFPGGTATVEYRESVFVGYRYYDTAGKDVLFPFGHGLSYTAFAYEDLKVTPKRARADKPVTVTFTVKNTGDRAGAEIAQVYVRDDASTIFRPEKELKGFAKVYLEPGEEKTVEIKLDKRSFAFFDAALHDWHVESGDFTICVGASSRDIRLTETIRVTSDIKADCPDYRDSAPTYYTGQIQDVSAEEFAAVYGAQLPDADNHDYPHLGLTNSLGDATGANGKKILGLIGKFLPPDTFMYAVITELPIRNFISMSMGVFSENAAAQLIAVLNDEKKLTPGVAKMIVGAIPDLVKGLPNLLKSI